MFTLRTARIVSVLDEFAPGWIDLSLEDQLVIVQKFHQYHVGKVAEVEIEVETPTHLYEAEEEERGVSRASSAIVKW